MCFFYGMKLVHVAAGYLFALHFIYMLMHIHENGKMQA